MHNSSTAPQWKRIRGRQGWTDVRFDSACRCSRNDFDTDQSDCSDVDEVDECEIEEVDLANMPHLVTSNDAFFAGLC